MNIQAVIQQIDRVNRSEIQERLRQIEAEEKQLRVLLRLAKRQEAKQQEAATCRK